MREKEMLESIIPLSPKKVVPIREPVTSVYTIHGNHDDISLDGYPLLHDPNSDFAFAKKIIGTKKTRFFVKMNSGGKLLNPIGMYTETSHNKQLKHTGGAEWQYTEVNEKVFTNYLNFLKSRNKAWLLNAERGIF